jgi:hypothetical protein
MNTRDRFDELLASRLRETAPDQAPDRLLDLTVSRISTTPQRGGRSWLTSPFGRVLAVAAVIALAVVVGTQLPGALERPVGNDPSPSASTAASANSSPSGSPTPAASASAPAPDETAPAVAEDDLVLRLVTAGGAPTYPGDQLPEVTLLNDGTLIWQPTPDVSSDLVSRQLTEAGLAQLREHIFGSGLLDSNATYELQPLPGAEPPGRGVAVHTFTAGEGDGQVEVTSVQWLGDDEESTYYEPSPEREQLDRLAQDLRDPAALVAADAWAGPAAAHEATEYLLFLTPYRDIPAYDTADVSAILLPLEGPLDEYGVASSVFSGPPVTRCGLVSHAEAAAIAEDLTAAGFEQVGLDQATNASLDWAEGSGAVDLVLLPRMPDEYPACEDQA